MIRRVLVANRGEIARRIIATCRRLGVETVAVHSDADAAAPYLAEADLAVRLPGNAPAATYLRADLILDAARRSGADAVHPGYGFLAENAEFAAAVADAGLTWIGPPAKAITAMGDKIEAKALLAEAGVPVLPTYAAPGEVEEFPVLVKAAAGGGGRGIRIVRAPAALAEELASARREAAAAFGDSRVFLERYVEPARHVEVQIFGDTFGSVLSLGERECSIQRRHQKIVEEAPAVIPDASRTALADAAVAAGRAVGYVGAGTVEFLLGPDGRFYFLEMNTRLQVEHPVTECVTGLDLVALQLIVADGEPLPLGGPPPVRGHAIEVRLCAEEPAAGWRPATGTLHRFDVADATGSFAPRDSGLVWLRLDSGVADGSVVTVHYDSMLAKVIAWAPSRAEAARALAAALVRAELHGVATNRDLLVRVLRSDAFRAAEIDTGFLDRHPGVFAPLLAADQVPLAAMAAALAGAAARRAAAPTLRSLPSGWRNVPSSDQVTRYAGPHGAIEVRYRFDRTGKLASAGLEPSPPVDPPPSASAGHDPPATIALVSVDPWRVVLDVAGVRRSYAVNRVGTHVFVDTTLGSVTLTELPRLAAPAVDRGAGSLVAPLPGVVTKIHVAVGQRVAAGDLLLTLEAMKLEHPVLAPVAGTVAELPVAASAQVNGGDVLAVVNPNPEEPQ